MYRQREAGSMGTIPLVLIGSWLHTNISILSTIKGRFFSKSLLLSFAASSQLLPSSQNLFKHKTQCQSMQPGTKYFPFFHLSTIGSPFCLTENKSPYYGLEGFSLDEQLGGSAGVITFKCKFSIRRALSQSHILLLETVHFSIVKRTSCTGQQIFKNKPLRKVHGEQ